MPHAQAKLILKREMPIDMPGFLQIIRSIAILPLLAAPAAGATIFVSNEKDNTVTVIDSVTLKVTKVIQTGARPRGMILTPDFKELIVCAGDDNRLDIVDTETLEIVRTLDSGPDPELLDVDSKGERIYVANEDDGTVTVMERHDGKVLAEITMGVEPEGMAVSPDDRITVATSEETSMAHIIDNASLNGGRQPAGGYRVRETRSSRATARKSGYRRRSAATSPSSIRRRPDRW